jgi:hypothetical protein
MTLEAMMKMDTPLHADHQLDQLSGQFEHWRQHRSHPHERIPDALWDQAVALTATLSASRVAKHLRLRLSDLKQQSAKRQGTTTAQMPPAPGFVEVPSAPTRSQSPAATEIALERPDGARLRLVCPETPLPLAAVVRAFLEGS